MPTIYPKLPLTGMNQAVAGLQREQAPFDVENFRPGLDGMHQTDLIVKGFDLTPEDSIASRVKYIGSFRTVTGALRYLVMTEDDIRTVTPLNTANQIKLGAVRQIRAPITDSEHRFAALGLDMVDSMPLGSVLNIEVTGSDEITWTLSRTSGVVTSDTAVPSLVTSLESGGATFGTVYFLASDGFNVGDLWSWQSFPSHGVGEENVPIQTASYRGLLYFIDTERRVLTLGSSETGGADYVTSVGMNQVFGKYLSIFQDHLVIGQYSPSARLTGFQTDISDSLNPDPYLVAWSHLNDFNQFEHVAALGDEAGSFRVQTGKTETTNVLGITGMATWGEYLYIYTPDTIYEMTYVGLPAVMVTKPRFQFGNIFSYGLVDTPFGHFFIGESNFFQFDGSTPRRIGTPIVSKFFSELPETSDSKYNELYGYYDEDREEVNWVYFKDKSNGLYQTRKLTYQIQQDSWFFQNLPEIYCVGKNLNVKYKQLYGAFDTIYKDSEDIWLEDIIKDELVSENNYDLTSPSIEWHWNDFRDPFFTKKLSQVMFNLSYVSGIEIATYAKVGPTEDDEFDWQSGKSIVDMIKNYSTYFDPIDGISHKLKVDFNHSYRPTSGIKLNSVAVEIEGINEERYQ